MVQGISHVPAVASKAVAGALRIAVSCVAGATAPTHLK